MKNEREILEDYTMKIQPETPKRQAKANPPGQKGETPKFHYFASCAFGWKTAPTRHEAVSQLAHAFYHDMKHALGNLQKDGELGPYIWSCKVLAPQDARYAIEYYQPRGISTGAGVHHYLTHLVRNKPAVYFSTEDAPKAYRGK